MRKFNNPRRQMEYEKHLETFNGCAMEISNLIYEITELDKENNKSLKHKNARNMEKIKRQDLKSLYEKYCEGKISASDLQFLVKV